jgi:hypothetical protein
MIAAAVVNANRSSGKRAVSASDFLITPPPTQQEKIKQIMAEFRAKAVNTDEQ